MIRNYDGESIASTYYSSEKTEKGKLAFEKIGLRFQGKGIHGREIYVLYQEIDAIGPYNRFGVIPNGISIRLKNGTEYRFGVSNRKDVIGFLNTRVVKQEETEEVYKDAEPEIAPSTKNYGGYADLLKMADYDRQKKQKREKFLRLAVVVGLVTVVISGYAVYEMHIKKMMESPRLKWDRDYDEFIELPEEYISETVEWFFAAMLLPYLDIIDNGWVIENREDAIAVVEELVAPNDYEMYETYVQELKKRDMLELSEDELLEQADDVMLTEEFYLIIAHYIYHDEHGVNNIKAYDYCRALDVLYDGYMDGIFSEEEFLDNSLVIAQELQSDFDSWEDLYQGFIFGYQLQYTEDKVYEQWHMYAMFEEILAYDRAGWPYSVDYHAELVDDWSSYYAKEK